MAGSFDRFAKGFHQDVFELEPSEVVAIDKAIARLSEADRIELQQFLEKSLEDNSPQEIRDLWWNTASDIYFRRGKDAVSFFRLVKERLIAEAKRRAPDRKGNLSRR